MLLHTGSLLTYCTNIHPGESWAEVEASLKAYLPGIKEEIAPDQPFGVGLRLGAQAAQDLLQGDHLHQFKSWLDQEELFVFTLNGFPYGDFHGTVVKDRVHQPDWTTRERLTYTRDLIQILAFLLPADMQGSISTSPLSYRHWHAAEALIELKEQTATTLFRLALELHQLEQETGKSINLAIEPEPDGVLENGVELLEFFRDWLIPLAEKEMGKELLLRHCTLCYDVCHYAVGFEEHALALDQIQELGIQIGKIQVSAALKVDVEVYDKEKIVALEAFHEPTYLHQVVIKRPNGDLVKFRDLDLAIQDWKATPKAGEWRVHFHVPIFMEDYGLLSSTQSDILDLLRALKQRNLNPPLEVETYTWGVLPSDLQKDLASSIVRELIWTRNQV